MSELALHGGGEDNICLSSLCLGYGVVRTRAPWYGLGAKAHWCAWGTGMVPLPGACTSPTVPFSNLLSQQDWPALALPQGLEKPLDGRAWCKGPGWCCQLLFTEAQSDRLSMSQETTSR